MKIHISVCHINKYFNCDHVVTEVLINKFFFETSEQNLWKIRYCIYRVAKFVPLKVGFWNILQIGVFWAMMLCSVMASCQTASHHITRDNSLLYMGSAARTSYFTSIYILPPLLTVPEAFIKLKIASSYLLVLFSSDILGTSLTCIPNCKVVILSSPMRTYQFMWQAEPWVIWILFLVASCDVTYSWSLSSVSSLVFVSLQFIL